MIMQDRAHVIFAMCLLLAATVSGLAGGPIWTSIPIGIGLALVPLLEQRKLHARFESVGATDVLTTAHLASIANGCIAAIAAWGVGILLRLLLLAVQ
jgi:hypothetical protein